MSHKALVRSTYYMCGYWTSKGRVIPGETGHISHACDALAFIFHPNLNFTPI